MFFTMFLKQTTVKLLIYTVETRLHYSCLQIKTSERQNKYDETFSSYRIKKLMVTHVSNNLNA